MRKIVSVVTALVLCLLLLPAAQAEDYPPFQGIVADVAGVLSEETISDLKALSQRMEQKIGGHIYVLTRHFLGGASPQVYADKVFEIWDLGENDALLLMVIGEESYALTLGSLARSSLNKETENSLLAASFRPDFLNRNYDQAVGAFSKAWAQALARAQGETMNETGLFSDTAAQSTPQPQSLNEIWQGMFAQNDYVEEPWDWGAEWEVEETHVNWRGILIWAIVIYFLFFRKKRRRR